MKNWLEWLRRHRRALLGEGVLIAALLAAAVFVLQQKRYSNAELLQHFDIIAFDTEFDGERPYVRRWEGPIRIFLHGPDNLQFRAELESFVAVELAPLTGRSFSFVEDEAAADMLVFYHPRKDPYQVLRPYWSDDGNLQFMLKDSQCFARIQTDRRARIVRALVAIPRYTDAERVRACIVEEMTQSMGLTNDADEVQPSIFNDRSRYTELTEHDRHLLRMLYDDRLRSGMHRRLALRIAEAILADIRPE